jgi:hypothetical protein
MPNWSRPRSAWQSTYHVGAAVGSTPQSSRADAGTRSTPKRKATTISQNVQRQRRSTPMPSRIIKAEIATRKESPAERPPPSGSLGACS